MKNIKNIFLTLFFLLGQVTLLISQPSNPPNPGAFNASDPRLVCGTGADIGSGVWVMVVLSALYFGYLYYQQKKTSEVS